MTNLKKEHQRPEGALIERALQGPPKVTMRELARRVEMSDARIRQIINGYHPQGDVVVPVRGPAETLARMATAIGLTADDLEGVGRDDAAAVIRKHAAEFPDRPDMIESMIDTDAVFQEMREWISAAPNGVWPGYAPDSGLSFWSTEQILKALAEREQGHREIVTWHIGKQKRLQRTIEELREQIAELAGGPALSAVPDEVDHLRAADDQETPISAEQGEPEDA